MESHNDMITHATDETFDELVLQSKLPVLVDFWAAWCGPCKMVAPEMEKLAEKYQGQIEVVKLDVDANQATAGKFGIQSIPVIALFEPGQAPKGVLGFKPAEVLEQNFELARFAATITTDNPTPEAATPVG